MRTFLRFAIYLSKLSSTSCGRSSEFLSIRFPYLRLFYHWWNEPSAAECFKEIVECEYLSWKFVGWKERLLSDIFVCFITNSTKRRLFWRKCIALCEKRNPYILLKKLIEITWIYVITDDDSLKKRYNEV